jgi:hypothetical protein
MASRDGPMPQSQIDETAAAMDRDLENKIFSRDGQCALFERRMVGWSVFVKAGNVGFL